jgi:hypothetical protein
MRTTCCLSSSDLITFSDYLLIGPGWTVHSAYYCISTNAIKRKEGKERLAMRNIHVQQILSKRDLSCSSPLSLRLTMDDEYTERTAHRRDICPRWELGVLGVHTYLRLLTLAKKNIEIILEGEPVCRLCWVTKKKSIYSRMQRVSLWSPANAQILLRTLFWFPWQREFTFLSKIFLILLCWAKKANVQVLYVAQLCVRSCEVHSCSHCPSHCKLINLAAFQAVGLEWSTPRRFHRSRICDQMPDNVHEDI